MKKTSFTKEPKPRSFLINVMSAVFAFFLLVNTSHAQIRVSGKVMSGDNSLPMPGVNILLKGTSTGTISGGTGNYSIEVPGESTALLFSSVGYNAREIVVGKRTTIDVSLATDPKQLSEVVVTALGYQGRKRRWDIPYRK